MVSIIPSSSVDASITAAAEKATPTSTTTTSHASQQAAFQGVASRDTPCTLPHTATVTQPSLGSEPHASSGLEPATVPAQHNGISSTQDCDGTTAVDPTATDIAVILPIEPASHPTEADAGDTLSELTAPGMRAANPPPRKPRTSLGWARVRSAMLSRYFVLETPPSANPSHLPPETAVPSPQAAVSSAVINLPTVSECDSARGSYQEGNSYDVHTATVTVPAAAVPSSPTSPVTTTTTARRQPTPPTSPRSPRLHSPASPSKPSNPLSKEALTAHDAVAAPSSQSNLNLGSSEQSLQAEQARVGAAVAPRRMSTWHTVREAVRRRQITSNQTVESKINSQRQADDVTTTATPPVTVTPRRMSTWHSVREAVRRRQVTRDRLQAEEGSVLSETVTPSESQAAEQPVAGLSRSDSSQSVFQFPVARGHEMSPSTLNDAFSDAADTPDSVPADEAKLLKHSVGFADSEIYVSSRAGARSRLTSASSSAPSSATATDKPVRLASVDSSAEGCSIRGSAVSDALSPRFLVCISEENYAVPCSPNAADVNTNMLSSSTESFEGNFDTNGVPANCHGQIRPLRSTRPNSGNSGTTWSSTSSSADSRASRDSREAQGHGCTTTVTQASPTNAATGAALRCEAYDTEARERLMLDKIAASRTLAEHTQRKNRFRNVTTTLQVSHSVFSRLYLGP